MKEESIERLKKRKIDSLKYGNAEYQKLSLAGVERKVDNAIHHIPPTPNNSGHLGLHKKGKNGWLV